MYRVCIGGICFNIIEAICNMPTTSIIISGEKLKNVPSKFLSRLPTVNHFYSVILALYIEKLIKKNKWKTSKSEKI